VEVLAHDPMADPDEALRYYGISLQPFDALTGADAVVIAVAHRFYRSAGLPAILDLCTNGTPIILDLKSLFGPAKTGEKPFSYWRL